MNGFHRTDLGAGATANHTVERVNHPWPRVELVPNKDIVPTELHTLLVSNARVDIDGWKPRNLFSGHTR